MDETKKIHLKIVTHEKVVFEDFVDEIYTKGEDGLFGVLPNHIPFMSALAIGVTKIIKDKEEIFIATLGGIFQLVDNKAIILSDTAEHEKDIDITRAMAAKERAEARLVVANQDNIDVSRAEVALARAIARINVKNRNV